MLSSCNALTRASIRSNESSNCVVCSWIFSSLACKVLRYSMNVALISAYCTTLSDMDLSSFKTCPLVTTCCATKARNSPIMVDISLYTGAIIASSCFPAIYVGCNFSLSDLHGCYGNTYSHTERSHRHHVVELVLTLPHISQPAAGRQTCVRRQLNSNGSYNLKRTGPSRQLD